MNTSIFSKLLFLILAIVSCSFQNLEAFSFEKELPHKINQGCPAWMREQINKDLAPYNATGISLSELCEKYLDIPMWVYVGKISILDNKVSAERRFKGEGEIYRMKGIIGALEDLCNLVDMPNVTLYLTIHDGLLQPDLFVPSLADFPVFVMSRGGLNEYEHRSVLIPDFEGLYEKYQVLDRKNIMDFNVSWAKKKPILVWRGSGEQTPYSFEIYAKGKDEFPPQLHSQKMNQENAHLFSRYILCQLSQDFPSFIDGRYTILCGLDKTFPKTLSLQGEWMPYEEQFYYKYHILLNGNAATYSNSGWKFFTNSVVFFPEPFMTQWYYEALIPYVHYVPVRADLEDIIEKIQWARDNDEECRIIAKNAREFALNNLTRIDYLVYFYYLLQDYSLLLRN